MKTLIRNGTIIDGTGESPTKGDILVIDDTIAEIEAGISVKDSVDREIDADGMWVLPGFINCHVHFSLNASPHPMNDMVKTDSYTLAIQGAQIAKQMLKAGITTVRDMGSKHFEVLSLRNSINQGSISGPRIVAPGQALLMTGGHFSGLEVNGVSACLAGARSQLHAGADFIKVMATGGLGKPDEIPGAQELTFDELKACFDVARMAGKKSGAHAHGLEGIKDIIRAGVSSVEHGTMMDEESMEMMIERKTYLVPTFAPYWFMLEQGKEKNVPEYMIISSRWVMDEKIPRFRKAVEKGVPIAFGTDGGSPINPHDNLEVECRCMIDGGMSPMDVIVSMTRNAADLLGLGEKVGTLSPGKLADIVILKDNPLEDIGYLVRIAEVLKNGRSVSAR
ncbi:amidohydrolase family protein [Thermodesulfobacteriota bacterium]